MDYLSINFIIYVGRWIISAAVAMPFLWLLIQYKCCSESKYVEYIHLLIVQIIGAFLFYKLDQLLLKG